MMGDMVAFLSSLLGHVRGGLHYVLVGAMYLVSGISGSKAADMAAVAPVLFPEMKQRGAKPGDLVALLAATGAQTETIPPSLVLITIGSVTGVSIAALFTGGLLPGVVLAITLSALVWWRYRDEDLRHVTRASGGEIVRAFFIALPAIALPFVIRYAVVEGIATATEVSTIGIVYAFIVGFLIYGLLIYRSFEWRRLVPMLIETACLSGAILLIIGAATGMAWGLTQSGFSRTLAAAMTGLPGGSASFIAVSIVAFTILGSVLEGIPAIVLFGPLLFPIARAVGVHEVHYAMIIILAMGIGLFAPPFGVGYYAACAIGRVDPAEGIRPIWGYLLAPLSFLKRSAAVYPDHVSTVYEGRVFTWSQTYARCRRFASFLADRNIGNGDTVAAMLPNIPAMNEVHFAVPMAGAVLNALNIRLDAASIAFQLDHGGAKIILVDPEFAGVIAEALTLMTGPKPFVIDVDDAAFAGGKRIGELEYEDALSQGDENFTAQLPQDEWDAIALSYTSGTTGNPKGVVTHHRGAYLNAVSNILAANLGPHPVY